MKKTFKEYLLEFDRGDIALQNQHITQQQAEQERTAFSSKMAGSTPVRGDMISTKAGKFMVTAVSPEGIQVQQLGQGGGRTITVPHTTKFSPHGKSSNGRNVFTVVV